MGAMFSPILPVQDADVLSLPPNHLINDPCVALNDLHDLGGDVLLYVIRYRDAVIAVLVHGYRRVHRLKQALFVDTREDEASLVQCFRPLGARADAHRRKRMAHAGEDAAFLRQRATIAHHAEGVHLQAVVVMETQRLVPDHARVKLEAGHLQSLSAARMAGVEDGHVVLLLHLINSSHSVYNYTGANTFTYCQKLDRQAPYLVLLFLDFPWRWRH